MKSTNILLLVLFLLLFLNGTSYAYLDPGTGSMILQIILGGLGGIAIIGKIFWGKIKSILMFRKKSGENFE